MKLGVSLWFVVGALGGVGLGGIAEAQTSSPLQIPIGYDLKPDASNPSWAPRLTIDVGIGGGPTLPYLVDTGSSMFISTYYPQKWGSIGTASPDKVPEDPNLPTQVSVTYAGKGSGYTGNILSVQNFTFGSAGSVTLPAASVGYQFIAASKHESQTFPEYFNDGNTAPPVEGQYYGTFGAGNFTAPFKDRTFITGGVFGQTTIGTLKPGYVVSANAGEQFGSKLSSGASCSANAASATPCITVGLTQALVDQFRTISVAAGNSFPDPYGTGMRNGGSTEQGATLLVTLTSPDGSSSITLTANGAPGLLDSGTPSFILNTATDISSLPDSLGSVRTVDGISSFVVKGGSTMTVSGVDGTTVLPSSTIKLVDEGSTAASIYSAKIRNKLNEETKSYTATIGLSFFLQNSVLYDLDGHQIGYTPFFVTSTDVSSSLTVGTPSSGDPAAATVPLGLAGAISGATTNVTVLAGGQLQLSSALNSYGGTTTIAAAAGGQAAGQLLLAGAGNLGASSNVINNGLLDLTRTTGNVTVTSLTGAGQVALGTSALVLQGASAFSGVVSGAGSVIVGSGTATLTGGNTYTGGTTVTGGGVLGISADNALGGPAGGLTLAGGTLQALGTFASARSISLGAGGGHHRHQRQWTEPDRCPRRYRQPDQGRRRYAGPWRTEHLQRRHDGHGWYLGRYDLEPTGHHHQQRKCDLRAGDGGDLCREHDG